MEHSSAVSRRMEEEQSVNECVVLGANSQVLPGLAKDMVGCSVLLVELTIVEVPDRLEYCYCQIQHAQ